MLPFIREESEGVCLSIKIQPRASKNEIGEAIGSELKIRVTAPPVDSAANQMLVEFLAEKLNCPRGAVQLVRGNTSRHKVVFLRGLTADMVEQRLAVSRQ
jgi:uncharacterized protein